MNRKEILLAWADAVGKRHVYEEVFKKYQRNLRNDIQDEETVAEMYFMYDELKKATDKLKIIKTSLETNLN